LCFPKIIAIFAGLNRNKYQNTGMSKKILFFLMTLFLGCGTVNAEEVQKSELQKRAEAVDANKNIAAARSTYIRAFEDYAAKGNI
jgi:hypothetical protein